MKKILKLFFVLFLIVSIFYIWIRYDNKNEYKIVKNDEPLRINYPSVTKQLMSATTNEEQPQIDIDSLIVKDEKYTQEYKTTNGETFTVIGSLKIPKINIEYDILSTTSPALLKLSLNRYWGPTVLNREGNVCIVGHNYLDSRFFGNLHTLKKGDVIEVTNCYGGTLKYYVYDKFVADPYDTRCTSQLTDGRKEITLITCFNKGTQRTVVKARAEIEETNFDV